jgi:(2Fe-2S) ferredoxin
LGQDEYATFSALYTRIKESEFPNVEVEETSCLGGCKLAPCVAIEHEDFVGSVAVEGMTTEEFGARIFHKIVTESDADRVWSSVENAIRIMAAEEEDL